jgi:hypothetical protein
MSKAPRGRPETENPLGERRLVRFDKKTDLALVKYAARSGIGAISTAIRAIVVQKLREEGLLK